MDSNISVLENTWLERKIFRAYDIRGHLKILTPTLITEIGFALAKMLIEANQKKVTVGFDARLTSADYAQRMIQAFLQSGLDVIEIGCVSSPVLYFAAGQYSSGNGVMITASHNAVCDNGVKWILQGLPPTPEQIQNVADHIEQKNYVFGQGALTNIDPLPSYYDYLQHDVCLNVPLKISIDGFHGSAGHIAHTILEKLGCEVDASNCEANGDFPLGPPDPSDPERLKLLQNAVRHNKSNLGIALDGDGDRLVVVDEQGSLISADRLMCLFAKICLKHHPNAQIVCDVKCSSSIAQTAQKYGGSLNMIRTGSSFLRRYLAYSDNAVFGGEFAGHYVFNDGRGKGFDDGLYVALRLIEYMGRQAQPLSILLAEFPERVSSTDVYIDCHGIDQQHLMQLIEQNAPVDAQIIKVDGLRLDFPFGFGIIRSSNTGEYFTVRFDADHQQHFDAIRQLFVQSVQSDYPAIAQAMAIVH